MFRFVTIGESDDHSYGKALVNQQINRVAAAEAGTPCDDGDGFGHFSLALSVVFTFWYFSSKLVSKVIRNRFFFLVKNLGVTI